MSLISFKNFKKECLKLRLPVEDKHGGIRIDLSYNGDKLHLSTPTLFSFGVQERVFNNKKIGYQIPLCLHSKNGPTQDEEAFIKCLKDIQEKCHGHLKKNYSPDVSEALSNIIYEKPSSQAGPMLYLNIRSCLGRIAARLRTNGVESSPLLDWMKGYSKVIAAISFDCIYIGEKSVSIFLSAEDIYFKPLPLKPPMLEIVEEEE